VAEATKEAVEEGKTVAAEAKEATEEKVSEAAEAVKEKAQEVVAETKEVAVEAKEKVAAAADSVAQKAAEAVAPVAPTVVVYEARNGNVTFDHAVHAKAAECAACHTAMPPAKIELDKDSAHQLCTGCHKELGVPSACTDCHKK